jgi:hypothetical protein
MRHSTLMLAALIIFPHFGLVCQHAADLGGVAFRLAVG